MMVLDNLLLKRMSVRMFSQSLFTFFKKVAMDGWNCVMKVMRFSLVFLLELRVKDMVRTMCDAWLNVIIYIHAYIEHIGRLA